MKLQLSKLIERFGENHTKPAKPSSESQKKVPTDGESTFWGMSAQDALAVNFVNVQNSGLESEIK